MLIMSVIEDITGIRIHEHYLPDAHPFRELNRFVHAGYLERDVSIETGIYPPCRLMHYQTASAEGGFSVHLCADSLRDGNELICGTQNKVTALDCVRQEPHLIIDKDSVSERDVIGVRLHEFIAEREQDIAVLFDDAVRPYHSAASNLVCPL